MKNINRLCLFLWIILGIVGSSSAQYPDWINYGNGSEIVDLSLNGDTLWVATSQGIAAYDKISGISRYYTRTNAPLPTYSIPKISAVTIGSGPRIVMATEDKGLVVKSSNGWSVLNSSDSDLPDDRVTSLLWDGSGHWVGTQAGLAKLDTNNNVVPYSIVATSQSVRAMVKTNDTLWVGFLDGSVSSFVPPSNWLSYTVFTAPVTDLTVDSNGKVWASSSSQGIAQFDGISDWTTYDLSTTSIGTNGISRITADTDGSLWIGTLNWGLGKQTPTGEYIKYDADNDSTGTNIGALVKDPDGTLWIGSTSTGLLNFDGGTTWVIDYPTSNSFLPQKTIQKIAGSSSDGNVWIYTTNPVDFTPMVSRFNGTDASNFDYPYQNFSISSISANLNLVVGTDGGGVYEFAGTNWDQDNGMSDDYVLDVTFDQTGRLWIATYNGIAYQKSFGTWREINNANFGLPNDFIRQISVIDSNNIWCGSEGGSGAAVYHYNGSLWETWDNTNSILPTAYIQDLAIGPNGDCWVGTESGVYIYNGTDWTNITVDNSILPSNYINVLYADDSSVLIGTGAGLVWGTAIDTTLFTIDNSGLPSNNIRDITKDSNGIPWIATDRGLVQFSSGGPAIAQLSYSSNELSFGQVVIGGQTTQVLRITNTGDVKAYIQPITKTGADTASFQILTPHTGILEPAQYIDITIRFNGNSIGSKTAYFEISSNAESSPYTVRLDGIVIENLTGVISFNQTTLDFGLALLGSQVSKKVTIKNGSTSEVLNVTSMGISGTQSTFFTLPNPFTSTVEPSDSQTVTVNYIASQLGTQTAYLIIQSNTTTSPDTITLVGSTGRPLASLSSESVNFGRVKLSTIASWTGYLTNTGSYPLTINTMQLTDETSFHLLSQFTSGTTIQPSSSYQINIEFDPADLLQYASYLVITSNASSSPDSISLSGQGVNFSISYNVSLDTVVYGSALNLSFNITNLLTTDAVWFYYLLGGAAKWDSLVCSRLGTTYTQEFTTYTGSGFAYYIAIKDTDGLITLLDGSKTSPTWVPVVQNRVDYPYTIYPEVYSMISVPYQLTDNLIINSLQDNFGTYDLKKWRLFHWKSGEYIQFNTDGNVTQFHPGEGYWLVTRDSTRFDLANVSSVPSTESYSVTLDPGWNQIGNPFSFAVDWGEVENTESVMAPVAWEMVYDDSSMYEYYQTVLSPWKGYFVYNNSGQSQTIEIPPIQSGLPKALAKEILYEGEVRLQLEFRTLDKKRIDTQNYLGMLQQSSDEVDGMDAFEAPAMEEGFRLSILDSEKRFAGNYKSISPNGQYWDLEVELSNEYPTGVLSFKGTDGLPSTFHCWLLDQERQCLVPIVNNQAKLERSDNLAIQTYRLIIGTEEFAQLNNEDVPLVPYTYSLAQNYPNPFNPETQINYTLPYRAHVRLSVFNMLGQEIAVLKNGMESTGSHSIMWDGKDASGLQAGSGIYIYQLLFEGQKTTKKMILVR